MKVSRMQESCKRNTRVFFLNDFAWEVFFFGLRCFRVGVICVDEFSGFEWRLFSNVNV